jgi:hypothetical protein
LLISLILFIATFALLGGAPVGNSSQPTGGYYHDGLSSGSLHYQHDIGPYDQNISIVNTRANRTVTLGDYGLVTVNDTVMVRNNGSLTASYWTFYLVSETYPKLRYVAAYSNGTSLDVVGGPPFESFVGMRVSFARIGGLQANSSVPVTLIQQYSGLVKPTPGTASKEVKLYFYRFLTSPYITFQSNVLVNLPASATTSEATSMTSSMVSPFNCTRLGSSSDGGYSCSLQGGQSLMEVDVDRTVVINVDGFLSVTETHYVKNIGPQTLGAIRFMLPLSLVPGSLEARDSSGPLPVSLNGSMVTISKLRYGLGVNWTFTYYVSYRAYIGDYRTLENGLYVIRMPSVTVYNCSVSSERTSVVFPSHAQVYSASQNPSEIKLQGDTTIVSYVFSEVTPLNTPPVELRYTENIAETFQRPMILSLGFFIIGLLYIGVRKVFPRGAAVAEAKETEEKVRGLGATVKEFCSNYEEKTALTLEIETLAEDRRKGRVSKRAFMERLQLAKRRIALLTNSINEDKKRLIPASKRYATIIRQLDTYEEERENARASLENLELRRRQGKVSGDVYNSLKYENTKKIEKATAGIDSLIVQFRQEAL